MIRPDRQRPFPIPFLRRHGVKLAALLFWLSLLGGYYAIIRKNDLTLEDSITQISAWLTESVWGPLFFILLYIVGPLLFFPATILSLLGGFLFWANRHRLHRHWQQCVCDGGV